MEEADIPVYQRGHEHYRAVLSAERRLFGSMAVALLLLAGSNAAATYWAMRESAQARDKEVVVVTYKNAAHPEVLERAWTPEEAEWGEIANTYAQYVRSRPLDRHVLVQQRRWAQARSSEQVENSLLAFLLQQDATFKEKGIQFELVSSTVQAWDDKSAVLFARWRERVVAKDGAPDGPWKPWASTIRLKRDVSGEERRRQDQAGKLGRPAALANPLAVYVVHFDPVPERA